MHEWISPQTLKNNYLSSLIAKTHQMCLLAQLQKEVLFPYKDTAIKYVENTGNSHNMFGKPHMQHFPLHPLVILSESHLQERMEKLLNQVSSYK